MEAAELYSCRVLFLFTLALAEDDLQYLPEWSWSAMFLAGHNVLLCPRIWQMAPVGRRLVEVQDIATVNCASPLRLLIYWPRWGWLRIGTTSTGVDFEMQNLWLVLLAGHFFFPSILSIAQRSPRRL